MSERFESSPIRLRRAGDGSVSIESGPVTVRAEGDEGEATERVPVPPPKKPPWRAKLRSHGELVLDLQIEPGTGEGLERALAEHGAVDEVTVEAVDAALTRQELAPLVKASRRHGVDIDVLLHGDG